MATQLYCSATGWQLISWGSASWLSVLPQAWVKPFVKPLYIFPRWWFENHPCYKKIFWQRIISPKRGNHSKTTWKQPPSINIIHNYICNRCMNKYRYITLFKKYVDIIIVYIYIHIHYFSHHFEMLPGTGRRGGQPPNTMVSLLRWPIFFFFVCFEVITVIDWWFIGILLDNHLSSLLSSFILTSKPESFTKMGSHWQLFGLTGLPGWFQVENWSWLSLEWWENMGKTREMFVFSQNMCFFK